MIRMRTKLGTGNTMMSREDSDRAFTLLKLLGLYCQSQDEWEEHYDKLFDGQFTKKEEDADHARLLEEVTRPMIQKAKEFGFDFSELMEIIPGNFSTNSKQRYEILRELQDYADVEYDLEIPF